MSGDSKTNPNAPIDIHTNVGEQILAHCDGNWMEDYGGVSEAKYFAVYLDPTTNQRSAKEIFIDVREGLKGFFLRDGIHDKWVTKGLQEKTGIKSDGKKNIKHKVFPTDDERDQGASKVDITDKSSIACSNIYQTNHIDIWPDNTTMYK